MFFLGYVFHHFTSSHLCHTDTCIFSNAVGFITLVDSIKSSPQDGDKHQASSPSNWQEASDCYQLANLAAEKSDCSILNMTDGRLIQSRNYRWKSWLTAGPSQKMIGQVNVVKSVSGRLLFHMTQVIWSTKLQSISPSVYLLKICDINQKM